MLDPELPAIQLGAMGESFVQYKLKRWGEDAFIVDSVQSYDIVCMRGDEPIRIQVKATAKQESTGKYRFGIGHGRSNKLEYETAHYDVLCLVALDIERLVFLPYQPGVTKRLPIAEFGDGVAYHSWHKAIAGL